MEITELIKDAFVFPSKDIGKLAIFIVLTILLSFLAVGGLISLLSGIFSNEASLSAIGIIVFIIALIIGFIVQGYQISVVKSGIELDDEVPEFYWKENLITGIKYLVVNIVYFIIPSIIVLVVGLITNVPGNIFAVINEAVTTSANSTVSANATIPAVNTVSNALMGNLLTSLTITAIVAVIVFLIFSFIETMAQARLAKTDDLGYSLNIIEAFKDIGRVGWGKLIAVIILIGIINSVIHGIIGLIGYYVPSISIISIIITPYLVFFASRATGLLYSDIA